jgi:hypothetical protein
VKPAAALLALALFPLHVAADDSVVSPAPASPKLELVKRLLGDLTTKQRIESSGNAEAKRLLDEATRNCAKAQALVDAKDIGHAEPILNEALKQVTAARRAVADPAPRISALKVRYGQMLDSVQASYASYERRVKESPNPASEAGELQRIATIIDSAKTVAAADQLEPAINALGSAEKNILAALNRLLGNATLDYTHRARSQAEAFEFQLARNHSYAELVPLAIEQMNPSADTVKLIDKNVAENVRLRAQAREQALNKDFESALASIEAGTALLQRALALSGLSLGPSIGE